MVRCKEPQNNSSDPQTLSKAIWTLSYFKSPQPCGVPIEAPQNMEDPQRLPRIVSITLQGNSTAWSKLY